MFFVGSVKSCGMCRDVCVCVFVFVNVCVCVCVCGSGGYGGYIHHAAMRVSIRRWVGGVSGRGGVGEGAPSKQGAQEQEAMLRPCHRSGDFVAESTEVKLGKHRWARDCASSRPRPAASRRRESARTHTDTHTLFAGVRTWRPSSVSAHTVLRVPVRASSCSTWATPAAL